MVSIEEKRVYSAADERRPVYVAGDLGVTVVHTSDDLVGEFGLEERCTARDAAGRDGRVAVATDEDVLVGGEDGLQRLGVGPAVAVGYAGVESVDSVDGAGDDLLVARDDGTVVRATGDGEGAWTGLGELADVRAIDGGFVAAESGVYRATDDLRHVGLEDAYDVAGGATPLAATESGLYRLGNGWMTERGGAFRAVSAADTASGDDGGLERAHAAGESGLLARGDDEWCEVELPVEETVVALDHGDPGVYAVTDEGTFLLSVGDGWNHQVLGLRGAKAVAAP